MAKPYVKLSDKPPSSWPSAANLSQMVEQRDHGLLDELTGRRGATALVEMLGSNTSFGLSDDDLASRIEAFGENYVSDQRSKTYRELVWDGLHDVVIILLLLMSAVSFIATKAWIEAVAICLAVVLIVNVAASTDYFKQLLSEELAAKLESSNKKVVVRDGRQIEVKDRDIVVGDVLAFSAHSLASIPCDGLLLAASDVKMDESALTGKPEPVAKDPLHSPFILSGTRAVAGSGRMLVVAVGAHSVIGKVRAAVPGGDGGDDDDDADDGGSSSPLFTKLDALVVQIGRAGAAAAALCFGAMCVAGFGFSGAEPQALIEYLRTSIAVLAVAVPEGLPLALTLALAVSSSRMLREGGGGLLVRHVDACEAMGAATTICADKTGTLTTGKMSVRAAALADVLLLPTSDAETQRTAAFGARLRAAASPGLAELLATLLSVCTSDESDVRLDPGAPTMALDRLQCRGDPTECALLALVTEMGFDHLKIRDATDGRSAATAARGRARPFTSSRRLASWVVPTPHGGWRLFCAGAADEVLKRCVEVVDGAGVVRPLDAKAREGVASRHVRRFAADAMRTVGLAYRDFAEHMHMDDAEWDALSAQLADADGGAALACETHLVLLGVLGVHDPVRPEVPAAVATCRAAGVDVRMVTADGLDTAVAVALRAGILQSADLERRDGIAGSAVAAAAAPPPAPPNGAAAASLSPTSSSGASLSLQRTPGLRSRAMEGADFRARVHRVDAATGATVFDQFAFDRLWPQLRVLAAASPADKLTFARGLRASTLHADAERVAALSREGVAIPAGPQVVAMTGGGAGDAAALRVADVGFARGGASGTQLAKDACDVVLLDDDHFASLVEALKWGRNVPDAVRKFLQFQLTVGAVATGLALVGAVICRTPPLSAVQLLWLNLVMDALAALALATEPPGEELLARPPVDRAAPLVTQQMACNVLGQALLQLGVGTWLVVAGARWLGVPDGDAHTASTGEPSAHYTIVFNAVVLMALCNELNCRKLHGEANVLAGVCASGYFVGVLAATFALQCVAVQFGGRWVACHPGGLTLGQWAFCLACGGATLLWQLLVNAAARAVRRIASTGGRANESGLLKFRSGWGNGRIRLHGTARAAEARQQRRVDEGRRILGPQKEKPSSRISARTSTTSRNSCAAGRNSSVRAASSSQARSSPV